MDTPVGVQGIRCHSALRKCFVVSCNHVTVVDTSSDVTDLFFDFKFVYHAYFPPKAIWFFAAARQLKFSPWTTTLVLLYF